MNDLLYKAFKIISVDRMSKEDGISPTYAEEQFDREIPDEAAQYVWSFIQDIVEKYEELQKGVKEENENNV